MKTADQLIEEWDGKSLVQLVMSAQHDALDSSAKTMAFLRGDVKSRPEELNVDILQYAVEPGPS